MVIFEQQGTACRIEHRCSLSHSITSDLGRQLGLKRNSVLSPAQVASHLARKPSFLHPEMFFDSFPIIVRIITLFQQAIAYFC
jgi:hypothetical protein